MRFQGVWEPKKKIVFIVGSRVHPRWVERSTRQERLSFLFGENVLYLCVLSVFCILPDMFCLDVISVEGYMFLCIKKVLSYRVGSTICSNCCVGKEPSGSLSLVHLLCNVLTFSNCIIAFSVRLCRMQYQQGRNLNAISRGSRRDLQQKLGCFQNFKTRSCITQACLRLSVAKNDMEFWSLLPSPPSYLDYRQIPYLTSFTTFKFAVF